MAAPPRPLTLQPQNNSSHSVVPVQVCKYSVNQIQVIHHRPGGGTENMSPVTLVRKTAVPLPFLETTFIESPQRKKIEPSKLTSRLQPNFPKQRSKSALASTTAVSLHELVENVPECFSCSLLRQRLAKSDAEVVILKDKLNSRETEVIKLRSQLVKLKEQNRQLNLESQRVREGLQNLADSVFSPIQRANDKKLEDHLLRTNSRQN